jgi:sugar O-acyltransferase (sialic acid O-acetyltransferase NeuD family)
VNDIVVFGTGGFGREVAELIEDINAEAPQWNMIGWLDGNTDRWNSEIHGLPVLGDAAWLAAHPEVQVIVAVGGPAAKRRIVDSLGVARFAILVHPSVRVRSRVQIAEGSIICEGTQLTTNIGLRRHTIVNIGCTIGHDCLLEDFSTVAPGVNISGNVRIGQGTDVGTGSKIIQGVTIGAWSIVGAGAVVSRDLPGNVTAVGVPAKVIKERAEGWQLA